MKNSSKLLLTAAPVLVYAAFLAWSLQLASQGRLPDPVATHWSASGAADGFSSVETHLGWASLAFLIPGIIWTIVLWLKKLPESIRKILLVVTGFLFAILAAIQIVAIAAQIDLEDATRSRLDLPFLLLFVPILLLLGIFLAKPKVTTGSRLEIRLRGLVMFSCDYAELSSVGISEVRARDFGGLGLRFSKGKVAFMPSAGEAIELITKAGETILVRTDRATELVREIKTRMGA